MKRKLAERVSNMQTSQDAIGLKRESISKVLEASKGKEIKQSPKVVDLTKPTSPLTRSSTRRISSECKFAEETQAQGQPILVEKIQTSPGKGEKTIKWLNKQLREAQDLII
jgi:hypothetical protein